MVALSLHSIVPVRTDAREGAEQNTQMLFGELAQVLEEQDRWTRIRLDSDSQEGWVDTKMIAPIAGDETDVGTIESPTLRRILQFAILLLRERD